jgi:hypothetical protein
LFSEYCLKVYPKAKINEMEEVLIDFLKQASHKKGGQKYKVTIVLCTNVAEQINVPLACQFEEKYK